VSSERAGARIPSAGTSFRHDALFYAGEAGFLGRVATLISDAVVDGVPMLVVVSSQRIELLRGELGPTPDAIVFADMLDVGHNPARLLPLWRDFVSEHAASGGPLRGIGEPVWAERSTAELVECSRQEALLNLAFAEPAVPWWLICPYDRSVLPAAVLAEAERNHPTVDDDGVRRESATYRGLDDVAKPFDEPLPEPTIPARELPFGPEPESLRSVRGGVMEAAIAFGLDPAGTGDLVLVVNEVATNSVRHGGRSGVLRTWVEGNALICEVRDAGRIDDPLVGRSRPPASRGSGFGLWLANQLCDLVQIRSSDRGSVVRLHVRR
jgi:anti-sigma regulatory factor (Ser/Thr protein kinase)